MPEKLKEFFSTHFCTLGTVYDVPCTIATKGDTFEKRRIVDKKTYSELDYESLLFLSKLKAAKTLRNFASGLIKVYDSK